MNTSTPRHPDVARPKFWKILVIEDDARWRTVIELYLQGEGHTVLAAADGQTGLLLAEEKPDLILCDIVMPGLTGYAVKEALLQQPSLRNIPFVFLSGQTGRADIRKGMVMGADDYLTKPFQREELLACIMAVMGKRASLTGRLQHYTEEYQREIVAPWAHELLTPLNGILGIAALMESEPDSISQSDLRELAACIRLSARRQQALARKIMHYFKLEELRLMGWSDPLALVEAGTGIQDEAVGLAEEVERSADLQLDCTTLLVKINPHWLRAAVREIVENAFKFSAPGTPVKVTGRAVDHNYQIVVTDQGPGITLAECATIGAFRQFTRPKQEQQGLGLGLAIARSVAQLHAGTLAFESGENGAGLRVTLTLPLAQ